MSSSIAAGFCFLLTGMSALICEVCWIRKASLAYGSSTWAMSVVLAVFFLGLAIGSFLFGRFTKDAKSPIRGYAWLELGVGIATLLSPAMFEWTDLIYGGLYSTVFESMWLLMLTRLLLVSLVMLPATTLMGGSLPLFCQQFVQQHARVASGIGVLYGLNTLGAAIGAAACGFWMIPVIGVNASIYLAGTVNLLVCVFALRLAKKIERYEGSNPQKEVSGLCVKDAASRKRGLTPFSQMQTPFSQMQRRVAASIFFGIGFVAVASEVLWMRYLSLWMPNTVYTYTLTLSVILIGIVLGSGLAAIFSDRIRWRAGVLGAAQILSALMVIFVMELRPAWWGDWFNTVSVSQQLIVVTAVMLVPSVLSGLSFPLAIGLVVTDLGQMGAQTGWMTAINLVGGILGSLSVGFCVLPCFGLQATLFFVTGLGLVLGLITWWQLETGIWKVLRLVAGLFAVGVWIGIPAYFRTELPQAFLGTDGRLVDFREGFNATVSVVSKGNTQHLEINRMWQGQNVKNHQIFAAHIPALLHGHPKRVLAIGLGTGQTAGSFLHHDIDRLDCLEIEDGLIQLVKQHFDAGWMEDSRVRMLVEDGRNFVTHTSEKYDVISIEVGQIYRPRIASFYTADFYAKLRPRLSPGGLVCQFLPIEFFAPQEFRTLLATFSEAFPQCVLWYNTAELLLIGFEEEHVPFDTQHLADVLTENKRLRNDFECAYWGGPAYFLSRPESFMAGFLCGPVQLKRLSEGGEVYREDRPYLEYLPLRAESEAPLIVAMLQRQLTPISEFTGRTSMDVAAANRIRNENLSEISARVMFERAQEFETAGNYEAAVNAYRATLQILPSYPKANASLGAFLHSQGEIPTAIVFYQRALAVQPTDRKTSMGLSEAFVAMGWEFGQQGKNDDAMKCFQDALAIDSKSTQAQLGTANVLQTMGKKEESRVAYEKLLAADPDIVNARVGLAYLQQSEGNLDDALTNFQLASKASPNNLSVLQATAWLLATHPDSAKRDAEQAKILAETSWKLTEHQSPQAGDALAASYAAIGEFGQAVEVAELAIQAAKKLGQDDAVTEIKKRKSLYENKQTYTQ